MTKEFHTFSSWDEVHVGDRLVWVIQGGKSVGEYVMEFQELRGSFVIGKPLEWPDILEEDEESIGNEWRTIIFGSPRSFDGRPNTIGWALEGPGTYRYDPSQAGDQEDDI